MTWEWGNRGNGGHRPPPAWVIGVVAVASVAVGGAAAGGAAARPAAPPATSALERAAATEDPAPGALAVSITTSTAVPTPPAEAAPAGPTPVERPVAPPVSEATDHAGDHGQPAAEPQPVDPPTEPATAPSETPAEMQAEAPAAAPVPTRASAAPTPVGPPRAPVDQRVTALVNLPWHEMLPDWTVEFHGPRSGIRGLTLTRERRIEIYVRPGDDDAGLAWVLAHEFGHALDVSYLTTEDRVAWRNHRGLPATLPWWPGPGIPEHVTGAGDFAEAIAFLTVGGAWRHQTAGPPTAEAMALALDLISS